MKFFLILCHFFILFFTINANATLQSKKLIVNEENSPIYIKSPISNIYQLTNAIERFGNKLDNKKVWASLKTDYQISYSLKTVKSGCQFIVNNIKLNFIYKIPELTNYRQHDFKVSWKLFQKKLREHEKKHQQIGEEAFNTLLTKLDNHIYDDCKTAEKYYFLSKIKTLEQIKSRNMEFDKKSYSAINRLKRQIFKKDYLLANNLFTIS